MSFAGGLPSIERQACLSWLSGVLRILERGKGEVGAKGGSPSRWWWGLRTAPLQKINENGVF